MQVLTRIEHYADHLLSDTKSLRTGRDPTIPSNNRHSKYASLDCNIRRPRRDYRNHQSPLRLLELCDRRASPTLELSWYSSFSSGVLIPNRRLGDLFRKTSKTSRIVQTVSRQFVRALFPQIDSVEQEAQNH